MPLFEVTKNTITYYSCIIEADNKEKAEDIAYYVDLNDCLAEESSADLVEDHTIEITEAEYEHFDKSIYPIIIEDKSGYSFKHKETL